MQRLESDMGYFYPSNLWGYILATFQKCQLEKPGQKASFQIYHYCFRYEKDISHTKSLLPYTEMTMEDFRDAHPDLAIDPINKPTFWPHLPEDQLGYEEKNQVPSH